MNEDDKQPLVIDYSILWTAYWNTLHKWGAPLFLATIGGALIWAIVLFAKIPLDKMLPDNGGCQRLIIPENFQGAAVVGFAQYASDKRPYVIEYQGIYYRLDLESTDCE
jgi:hypothetical protein